MNKQNAYFLIKNISDNTLLLVVPILRRQNELEFSLKIRIIRTKCHTNLNQ